MRFFKPLASILALIVGLGSCTLREDPGPIQYQEQPFVIADFDRLDIGDAMFVTVTRGNLFSVLARGDRRNLDDLEVYKAGNTLVAKFGKDRNRKHTTYITITLPSLVAADFYGATTAYVSGFVEDQFLLNLSGASFGQVDMEAQVCRANLSGASNLTMAGASNSFTVDLSGASLLKAYNMEVEDLNVKASGASHAYVKAGKTLVAEASGASSILYRGGAVVTSSTSGGSSVIRD
ncbi:MAG: DUF2807 domain-containing protein [Cyclobacteriaceae bacterium]|nr:DUF2807 domain-containing protein [Cyclobacteriaceae bacterium]MCB9238537.1 DUF2807 domain-containing protein [Flammeovirgaceae bacterium]MCW5902418.1 DUF2807 domain-containing protein [Cyclobacteriaceae bacterium]